MVRVFVFTKGLWLTLTALAVLIAVVTTVIRSITDPAVGNAAVVRALKLRG